MTRPAIAAAVVWLALQAPAGAHRLDEYLQVARIALAGHTIALEIDLTPGVDVADRVVSLVDRDGDAVLSEIEQRRYASAVLEDARLELDGVRVPLSLSSCEFPPPGALRAGTGTIHVRAAAEVAGVGRSGPHALRFVNAHAREMSVYLANALVPADGIVITDQRRDVWQREFTLHFTGKTRDGWPAFLSGLGVLGLLWRVRAHGRSRPRVG